MPFGPADEVRYDQEVAGKAHFFDNAQFIFKAGIITLVNFSLLFRRHSLKINLSFHSLIKSFIGLFGNKFILGFAVRTFKNRQQRINLFGKIIATLGNANRAFDRFRQVAEKFNHFRFGAEAVIGRKLFAVIVGNIFTGSNASQRIMRFIHISIKKECFVGGNQRDIIFIGQIDKIFLGALLGFETDAHNLHIQTGGENLLQFDQRFFGFIFTIFQKQTANLPFNTTGQGNQPGIQLTQVLQANLRFFKVGTVEVGDFHQLHNIMIAFIIHDQQDNLIRLNHAPFGL